MKISPKHYVGIESRYPQLQLAVKQGKTISPFTWSYYQDSEQQLIELMQGNPPAEDAPGNIEVSWALYDLNNHTSSWMLWTLKALGMPDSKILPSDWAGWWTTWEGQGVLAGDGTLVSTAPYAVVDLLWSIAFLDYLLLELDMESESSFGTTPATLAVSNQSQLVLALFADWGTGNYTDGNLASSPSQLIRQQIASVNPDISIHLGDVYYSGTEAEENSNLVNCWPQAKLGNFTLNSNHEMYDGANGLFGTALAAPVFQGQNNTTYFKIEFGNWLIVGLDTAYYDTSVLYMTGALVDSNQVSFLNQVGQSKLNDNKKILLLTHHNPLNTTGSAQTSLWGQIVSALGTEPDYWYWGHIHNGIVYSSESAAGAQTNCRCIGNGAIPIGNASWLSDSPSTVSFYTQQALQNPALPQQKLRIMNGYAVLTFTNDAVVEEWYYQDGSKAWSSDS